VKKTKVIIRDYLNGVSVINLTKKYEMTREAIYLHLRTLPNWKEAKEEYLKDKIRRNKSTYLEDLPRILKLRRKGLSATQISKKLNIHYRKISYLLLGTKYDNTQTSKEDRDKKIVDGYASGMTQTKLAKKFGLVQTRISAILTRERSKQS